MPRALLEARGYEVHPASDTELNTVWRQSGQQGTGRSYTLLQRRYHVQGQRVGPLQSVVRIFRVERVANASAIATRQPRAVDTTGVRNTEAGKSLGVLDGFRQEAERRQMEDDRHAYYKDDSRGTKGGTKGLDNDPTAHREVDAEGNLKADPRFAEQTRMPDQGDLRGSNERGVRDLLLERELVQRLEQFASLEFTGGGHDPAEDLSGRRAPSLTDAWEREAGGVPFASASPCGQPVAGLEPLASEGSTVLVGEQLGTREVPAVLGNLACQLASSGRTVVLALPLPADEQLALDAYLRSMGQREDQEVLLNGDFWRQVPRDGRSSRALLGLLERVRQWRKSGLALQVVAYDVRDLEGDAREAALARALLVQRQAQPRAVLLALGGNAHVTTRAQRGLQPLGARLVKAGLSLRSLDVAFARGLRWACNANARREPGCRVYAAAPTPQSYSPPGRAPGVELFASVSGDGFHGLLHVGPLSAALPALLPASLAAR